jgi:lysozyme family protein
MKQNLEASLELVLRDEGSSLRFDPLPRRFGLQVDDLARLWGSAGPSDLKELEEEEAKVLLASTHWTWGSCDALAPGLDYFYFDTSVHCGFRTAARWLGELTGMQGLELNPWVVDRANKMDEIAITGLEFFRRRRYKVDPLWNKLGTEWTNRCNRAKSRALSMRSARFDVEKGKQYANAS